MWEATLLKIIPSQNKDDFANVANTVSLKKIAARSEHAQQLPSIISGYE